MFPQLMEEGSFAMTRRTWIDIDGNRWAKRHWSTGLDPLSVNVLKGMLVICI